MKERIEKNEEQSRDLIVLWPIRQIKWRRRWYDPEFAIVRWQLGLIGPHKIFSLQFLIGPLMILTG